MVDHLRQKFTFDTHISQHDSKPQLNIVKSEKLLNLGLGLRSSCTSEFDDTAQLEAAMRTYLEDLKTPKLTQTLDNVAVQD